MFELKKQLPKSCLKALKLLVLTGLADGVLFPGGAAGSERWLAYPEPGLRVCGFLKQSRVS